MFPEGTPDPEYPDNPRQNGVRKDKRNLVQEWQDKHQVTGAQGCGGHGRAGLQGVGLRAEAWLCPLQGARYVWNRTALIQASQDPSVTHLMGKDPPPPPRAPPRPPRPPPRPPPPPPPPAPPPPPPPEGFLGRETWSMKRNETSAGTPPWWR